MTSTPSQRLAHAARSCSSFQLIDGALARQSREDVVNEMAAILISADAYQTEAGAIRVLMQSKVYSGFEILRFLDDARQAAAQEIVAREMSAP